jgi:class 3 adenylate cyclase/tetratricopeptide (TPR) repeat protein
MVRKTVTLVFCDVADSTPLGERLDPESLRGVWSSYHETAREVLERHGGTIEKFVGDAVMAAFGIPVVHEDDALRAVRAAVELREAFAGLNDRLEAAYGVRIQVRTGVNTGEVIVGDAAQGHAFATGDAVVVAQRLESAAGGGEILVGDSTIRLVRDAVVAEPIAPLDLKGKSEPVKAWRLDDVLPGAAGVTRRLDSPLVGRMVELARLRAALDQVVLERSCRVVTVLGDAGVGKSRLAAELVTSLGENAHVLEGRCLPYGNGITYWPLVEIVRGLDLDAILAGQPDRETVHGRLLEAVGRAEPHSRSDELYWAFRRLLETLAREQPVLLLLDDVQWAEPAFLDLIEYLAGWTRDAPILVCCLARSDLADVRPAWAGTPTVRLAPLQRDDARQLLENLAGPLDVDAADALGRATGGNPLFLEEMLRMLVEDGVLVERDGRMQALTDIESIRVPETVQAVLAARLDRLLPLERGVLQRAAVMGQVFWWGAVADLTPAEEQPEVAGVLQALVRKGLLRPDLRTFAGEDGFGFAHILVRDAAYDSMPKSVRADLHERCADWIEARTSALPEFDEILGHHLGQAHAYLLELGPPGAAESVLAARAAERLVRAGRRALARDDAHAAANLLGRAAALRPEDAALLVDYAEAYFKIGDFARAEDVNAAAIVAAEEAGDARSAIAARLGSRVIDVLVNADGGVDEYMDEINDALPTFEAAGDDSTVARLLTELADVYWWRCQIGPMEATLERALEHARRAENPRRESDIAMRLGFATVMGPLAIELGRPRLDELIAEGAPNTAVKGFLLVSSSLLAAMAGEFEDARSRCREGKEILDALGRGVGAAAITTWSSAIELLAGNPGTAERELRPAVEHLQAIGERGNLASVAAQLAEALNAQGRSEEALAATVTSEGASSPDDIHAQISWRVARAKVLAQLGRGREAEETGRAAVDLAGATDSPVVAAEALLALAEAHAAAGETAEGHGAAIHAQELYEAKGNVVAARSARSLSEELAARTALTRG